MKPAPKSWILKSINDIIEQAGIKCHVCGSYDIIEICAGCEKSCCADHIDCTKRGMCTDCMEQINAMSDTERETIDREIMAELGMEGGK